MILSFLQKNEDYWDAANVDVDTVNIAMIEKEPTVATNFKSGSLDYIGKPFQTIDLNVIDEFKKRWFFKNQGRSKYLLV